MAGTGLSEFKEVLADFKELNSLALKGTIALPLADIWLKLGPPPSKTIAGLTTLMEFLAVIWVFHFWSKLPDRRLRTRMKIAAGVVVIGIAAAVILLERYSVVPGEDRERVIEGYTLRPDVRPLINNSYLPSQALRDSEYDAERVWTRDSIIVLHASIAAIWTATFISFAIYLTVFIVLQRRQQKKHLRATSLSVTPSRDP